MSIGADQFTAKDKHAGCRCDARNFPRIVFPIQDAASGLYIEQTVMDSDSEYWRHASTGVTIGEEEEEGEEEDEEGPPCSDFDSCM